jgi:hypothetical protein
MINVMMKKKRTKQASIYDSISIDAEKEIDIEWKGPYAWPKFETESNLPAIPKHPGVYLQTSVYENGYIIYAAGITRRPIPQRFREHTRKYLSGDYTILDMDAMKHGVRKEIWHGWGWTPDKRNEYERRKSELLEAARKQLSEFHIFVADVGTEPRILERIEGAIMYILYENTPPFCDIPDRGMQLSPRWKRESPITAFMHCPVELYGIPKQLEI